MNLKKPQNCLSYHKQCCGYGIFIPDPNFSIPGSRVQGKQIPDPDPYQSWIMISDPDIYFLPIPDPGSKGQKGTGSRIRNIDHKLSYLF